jgi:hypothetical protein
MLAEHRERHPALKQIVLRVGTILGPSRRKTRSPRSSNDRWCSACAVASSPFVFIWDQDVVADHRARGGRAEARRASTTSPATARCRSPRSPTRSRKRIHGAAGRARARRARGLGQARHRALRAGAGDVPPAPAGARQPPPARGLRFSCPSRRARSSSCGAPRTSDRGRRGPTQQVDHIGDGSGDIASLDEASIGQRRHGERPPVPQPVGRPSRGRDSVAASVRGKSFDEGEAALVPKWSETPTGGGDGAADGGGGASGGRSEAAPARRTPPTARTPRGRLPRQPVHGDQRARPDLSRQRGRRVLQRHDQRGRAPARDRVDL